MVTVALEIFAPEGSLTEPLKEAVVLWASADGNIQGSRKRTANQGDK
jgi:hypothetical protein